MWYGKCSTMATPICLSGNTTVVVKAGQGMVHTVVINTKGSNNSTLRLYDGLSADSTLIASIDTSTGPASLLYDCMFQNGLTAVLQGNTPPNVTIMWT